MSEGDSHKILGVLPEACLLVDEGGKVVAANSPAARLLERSAEEIPGTDLTTLLLDPPEVVRGYLRHAAGASSTTPGLVHLPGRNGAAEPWRAEAACLEPWSDGRRAVLFLRLTPRLEEADRFQLLTQQIQRLADEVRRRIRLERERKELIQSERAARAEAEKANRLKDDFLAVVSHELRTPLNNILIWSALLRAGSLGENDVPEALRSIERGGQQLGDLIQDLLDVSSAVTGRLRLRARPGDLAGSVREGVKALETTAELKGVALRTELPPTGVPFRGDLDRIRRIVWHLVSNAVKFTPSGGTVTVRLSATAGKATVAVSDTGVGIDPDALPFVFERFEQIETSRTRTRQGLGLGLSTVRHLTELHGGTVAAHSEGPGRGATFTVVLPLGETRETGRR